MVEETLPGYAERLQESMGGMSIQALADAMGISYQAVKKVLDGGSKAFTVPNHYRAADVLKVNPRWLGIGEGSKRPTGDTPGWPLTATLLAALQNADATSLIWAENGARAALRLPALQIKETGQRPA